MSLRQTREVGRPTARTILHLLAVVGALIIGLLAMHTFTSSMGTHADSTGSSAQTHTGMAQDALSDAVVGTKSFIAQCPGSCGPDASMAFACVLALLLVTALLAAPRSVRARWSWRGLWRGATPRVACGALAALAPDLHVLSICRT